MKFRNIFLTIASLTVVAGVHEVSAQRKLITLEDYSKATLPVSSKSREMTRRVVGTEETMVDGVVTKTVETVIEAVVSGGARFYMRTTERDKITEIDKISDSANDLLNKMNAIIWSMNSSNDTLPNLVSYIRSYAITYFENLDIKCRIDINDEVPEKELYGEKRRNIFLTVKEALNNIVKHSKATAVVIDFSFEKNICIKIQDNGIGINHNKLREFGNGLKNMRKRMESMGGNFETHNNVGTTIKLCIPFDYSLPSAK